MDLLQRFKNYCLGLTPNTESNQPSNRQQPPATSWYNEDDTRFHHSRGNPEHHDTFGFNIFSSPLEMHRYFEHNMNEMLKNFGIFTNDDSFFGNFGDNSDPSFGNNSFGPNVFDSFQFPSIDDLGKETQTRSGSLRDQCLKPGYEAIQSGHKKVDQDVDEKFSMSDLDVVLKNTPAQVQPKKFFFGQSVISKTIRNADGTLESHKTIRDQDGNEQTVVTKRHGDKEYTVTTKTNKDGLQEIQENLVNLDESEKETFFQKPQRKLTDPRVPRNDFPYNKFF